MLLNHAADPHSQLASAASERRRWRRRRGRHAESSYENNTDAPPRQRSAPKRGTRGRRPRSNLSPGNQIYAHRGISLDLGIAENYFDSRIESPAAVLRLLHYPGRAENSGSARRPPADQPGAGEHTDYGNITLLATDGVAGLEVRQLDGTWLEVADTQDLLLCNIGDCLMRWTNDAYRSTPHRVRVPDRERHSIAFFLDANPDAIVAPILPRPDAAPRYPPISVRD